MQETQKTWVQSLGREDPLEEEMATHPSILARIIPWTEEPGTVLSLGSQRVDTTESLGMLTRTCVHDLLSNKPKGFFLFLIPFNLLGAFGVTDHQFLKSWFFHLLGLFSQLLVWLHFSLFAPYMWYPIFASLFFPFYILSLFCLIHIYCFKQGYISDCPQNLSTWMCNFHN